MNKHKIYDSKYTETLKETFFNQLIDFLIAEHSPYYSMGSNNKAESITKDIYSNLILNHFEKITWSNGGTSNSYTGQSYHVSPEPEPEFDLLDKFLEKNYPNINFLQYKKILKTVDSDSYNSSDYYGGSQEMKTKIIYISNLHSSLVASSLIPENDYSIKPEDMLDIIRKKATDFVNNLPAPVKRNKRI